MINRYQTLTICFLFALLIFGIYLPAIYFDFAYDDFYQIVYNPLINGGGDFITGIKQIVLTPTYPGDLYRPVTTFSYLVQTLFSPELNSSEFHLVNIILHLMVTIILWFLLRIILQNFITATICAALFSIHPIHTEAVAGIVGRAELLSTFFGLSALILLIKNNLFKNLFLNSPTIYHSALFLLGFLSMASKESGVMFIGLGTLLLYHQKKSTITEIIYKISPLAISAVCFLALRVFVLSGDLLISAPTSPIFAENPLLGVPFISRIYPSISILGEYFFSIIAPLDLSPDYSLAPTDFFSKLIKPLSFFWFFLILTILGIALSLRKTAFGIFLLWFFISFALTSNIFFPIGTIRGDRLTYLPSIGIITGAVLVISNLIIRINIFHRHVLGVLAAAIMFSYSNLTLIRLPAWKNNETLFTAMVQDNPKSPKAHLNLGMYWYHTRKSPKKSLPNFGTAWKLYPSMTQPGLYLIDIATRTGQIRRAARYCKKIIRIDSSNKTVRRKLRQLITILPRLK